MEVKPYRDSEGTKKEQVAGMFDKIAFRYDFLNHFLSMNIDKLWRKKVMNIVKSYKPARILDVATGTGDLAIAAMACKPERIDGIDISEGMLEIGRKKIVHKKLDQVIRLQHGDAESIPFYDLTFDAITVAFGVRNFENLDKGLGEMFRVLKPGGICVVLEFTMPVSFPVKQLYQFYFRYILPGIGRLFSKDASAYSYLHESVQAFPQREAFLDHMKQSGFSNVRFRDLSMGIAAIYTGSK